MYEYGWLVLFVLWAIMRRLDQTNNNWVALLIIAASIAFTISCSEGPTVVFQVVDDEGNPVEAAEVSAGYTTGGGWTGTQPKTHPQKGLSDQNGSFVYQGLDGTTKPIFASVSKKGYYETTFAEQTISQANDKDRPIKLILRKIDNPVPMYARDSMLDTAIEIPEKDTDIGFDLTLYDWVEPYGSGKTSDFIFNLEKQFNDWNDYESTLKITFTNVDDGILSVTEDTIYGSKFKLPRYAPESGYKSELVLSLKNRDGRLSQISKSNSYVFRVRSTDGEGSGHRKAMYGKIRGPIEYDVINSDTALILMNYYLNPDNSRNLEFDVKQNLFAGLPTRSVIRHP